MAKEIQLFKGGWNKDVSDRIVPNQRPADGHIKSAAWESYHRLNKDSFGCASACRDLPNLEVGDIIQVHTTLTFGNVLGFGIVVHVAEEGLRLQTVARNGLDLSKILVNVYEYDEDNQTMVTVREGVALNSINDIGSKPYYYAGYVAGYNDVLSKVTDLIGFKVLEVPASGVAGAFDIETRLHQTQPARPPANLVCC